MKSRSLTITITAIIAVALAMVLIPAPRRSKPEQPPPTTTTVTPVFSLPPTEADKMERYGFLMANRVGQPIKPGHHPVQIFKDAKIVADGLEGVWRASGLIYVQDGVPKWLLSCSHNFHDEGNYHMTILTPYFGSEMVWAVKNLTDDVFSRTGEDIAILEVGSQPTRIKSAWNDLSDVKSHMSSIDRQFEVTHSVTGEKRKVVGVVTAEGASKSQFIIDYPTVRGESGMVFYGPDNQFLVVTGWFVAPKGDLHILGIESQSDRRMARAVSAKVTWPAQK